AIRRSRDSYSHPMFLRPLPAHLQQHHQHIGNKEKTQGSATPSTAERSYTCPLPASELPLPIFAAAELRAAPLFAVPEPLAALQAPWAAPVPPPGLLLGGGSSQSSGQSVRPRFCHMCGFPRAPEGVFCTQCGATIAHCPAAPSVISF
ncbi:unnamed protein product, partial [Polarella glacialis]